MSRKQKRSAIGDSLVLPKEFDFQAEGARASVKLFKSNYIARSEARRLLANLENFREIVLDFRDVQSVGQGFADEVFRVFASRNPGIVIHSENTSPPVTAMIRHVGQAVDGSTPNTRQ
jgi:hypothetical protein